MDENKPAEDYNPAIDQTERLGITFSAETAGEGYRAGYLVVEFHTPNNWPESAHEDLILGLETLFGMRAPSIKMEAMQARLKPTGRGPGGIEMVSLLMNSWVNGAPEGDADAAKLSKLKAEYPVRVRPFTNNWQWKVDTAMRTVYQDSGVSQTIKIQGQTITSPSGVIFHYGPLVDAAFRAKIRADHEAQHRPDLNRIRPKHDPGLLMEEPEDYQPLGGPQYVKLPEPVGGWAEHAIQASQDAFDAGAARYSERNPTPYGKTTDRSHEKVSAGEPREDRFDINESPTFSTPLLPDEG